MSPAAKIVVLLIAVLVALVGGYGYGHKAGASGVQDKWNAERTQIAQANAKAEREAREEETRRGKEARRVIEESAVREAALRARAVGAERSVVSLRDEIARLNARPAPEDPIAAGFAHEARVARELLGSCSKEYRVLAEEADGLRDQVIGLQDWVSHVNR